MKAKCIEAVSQALGRSLTQAETANIETRIRKAIEILATEDREAFISITPAARLQQAAAFAAKQLVHDAELKKFRTALTIKAHDAILNGMVEMKNIGLSHADALSRFVAFKADGKSRVQSAESLAISIRTNALRQLLDTFEATDPKIFGLLENKEGVRDLTREIFGEHSGNALAKKGAEAWLKVSEAMRKQFNAAGGDIGRLENWAVPQHHSQLRVAKAGVDKWLNDIFPKLERSQYVNEDGSAMSDLQLTDFLKHVWETIATGGINKIEPGRPRGAGMRANRNAEPRQLHFKDADSYLKYQRLYGEKDLYGVMVGHVDALSKDIAMVETFGPNSNHTFSYFRDLSLKLDTEANPIKAGKAKKDAVNLSNLYDFVGGRTLPVADARLAKGFDTLRNWLVATRLGSAFITAFSDEATLHMTAHINNLPEMQLIRNQLATLNPANKMELRLARRAGLALETLTGELNRFGQDGLGRSFSSKMANFTMRASGLNAITDARKRAFGVTFMSSIGQLTKDFKKLGDLDKSDNRILLSKGITEKDWSIWKLADHEDWGGGNDTMLTPESIARIPDSVLEQNGFTPKDRRNAIHKLLGTVLEETDMAVITPGARERAIMGANLQRGTWKGELTRSFFLFKSFPLSMILRHWMRGNGMPTAGGKAAYIASLVVATTVLGALSLEVDQILQGKDPRTLNPNEKGGVRNWFAAMMKGGSLGIYGDFLFSEATQGGSSAMASLAGPVAGLVEETLNLTQGNLVQYAQGKDTNIGVEGIRALRGNTPGANIWYVKAALDRMAWNQAAEYLSPGYLSTIRSRARHQFGQDYYWNLDQATPSRLPDLSKVAEE